MAFCFTFTSSKLKQVTPCLMSTPAAEIKALVVQMASSSLLSRMEAKKELCRE